MNILHGTSRIYHQYADKGKYYLILHGGWIVYLSSLMCLSARKEGVDNSTISKLETPEFSLSRTRMLAHNRVGMFLKLALEKPSGNAIQYVHLVDLGISLPKSDDTREVSFFEKASIDIPNMLLSWLYYLDFYNKKSALIRYHLHVWLMGFLFLFLPIYSI